MNASIPVIFLNQNPNSKATFRPGGDAQYVSYVVQGIANSIADENHAGQDFETYYRELIKAEATNFDFSPALKTKFVNAASRLIDRELDRIAKRILKDARKAAKNAKKNVVYGEITGHMAKVGRWTYPVRSVQTFVDGKLASETFERNTKTDGSGEWVAVDEAKLIDA